MPGRRSNSRENTSRCIAALVSYGHPNVHQISYLHPVGRFEQGEESPIVERHSVHVREHLDAEGAELGDGSLELNDALVGIVERE